MPLIVGVSFLFQCYAPQCTIRLVETEFTLTLPSRFKGNGSIAQLNRASDYGSEGWGFESLWDHGLKSEEASIRGLFFIFHSAFRTVLLLPTARFSYSQSLKSGNSITFSPTPRRPAWQWIPSWQYLPGHSAIYSNP